MSRLTLGERQYRHRRVAAYRRALALPLPSPRDRVDRRVDSQIRRLIRLYNAPALIHNGRKPRNV
ncbi:hypothetical protein SEA_ITER_56 [Arthrobacter phage Iter]|uniref:Uncharacterized protein n=1 Tax=Arthrobacter phage Ascela TaxID=3038360 RepID=A0AAF0K2E7_9CAUD|nr:hypothetical protein SEA_ITER_56 [Arthrobacter phage Iter]WGH21579.1 hypothetical protein SEA_ASCELA_56 [Arthrobacter phage Ascela]